jgi:hypothetical protein
VGPNNGLPSELTEYLTIRAIGTILGVTKDVDMKFTREYERAQLQVLVLDPSLIPQSIDVVIGEFIYELHFRVERTEMTHLVPTDMEDDTMDDREEEGDGHGNSSRSMQQDLAQPEMAEQIIRVVQLWQKVKILPRGKRCFTSYLAWRSCRTWLMNR